MKKIDTFRNNIVVKPYMAKWIDLDSGYLEL